MIGPKVPKPTAAESRAAHEAVAERSAGVCEGCGERPATEHHHRQHGADGRVDTVDNMLDLCGRGNHTGCHGEAHSGRDGYLLGWAVKSGNDPARIPVYHLGRDVFTLRGEVIAHATAIQLFVDAGVVPDVATYVAWFEGKRAAWARKAVIRR